QPAGLVAVNGIDELIRTHGRSFYAATEDKARAALTVAKNDAGALERLVKDYPNAVATLSALRQLAQVYEDSGRWGAAVQAYRRLLLCSLSEIDRKTALAGLDRTTARERARFAVSSVSPDPGRPQRGWEKEERLLPLMEDTPGKDLLLARD